MNRAVVVNAQVKKGDNVLITGIGGGVALIAMQLCLGIGANVYVTSGQRSKIDKAVALGAKAGVNYKDSECFSLYADVTSVIVIIDQFTRKLAGRTCRNPGSGEQNNGSQHGVGRCDRFRRR